MAAEHWDYEFFKLAKPKQQERGGLKLATTTDTQEALDGAADDRKHRDAEREPSFIYTEVRPAQQEQDGSTEHNDVIRRTDVPKKPSPTELNENMVIPLTPEQQATANANYQIQLIATKAALPDFEAVMDQPEIQIPTSAIYMIRNSGLPNGPLVAYYLAKHRTECERLAHMTEKEVQQRIVQLSASLVTNPEGQVLDTAPYRVYRKVRNEQVRNQYGNRR